MKRSLLVINFALFCAFISMIISTKAYSQWYDGFMYGSSSMMMGGNFDGHRYHYTTPSGDTTVTGKAIVDTVIHGMVYYRLDVNNDNKPDFYLDFGPWWYQPDSTLKRPVNGETVTIKGKVFPTQNIPGIILVTEINGKTWKRFTMGYHYSGNWIKQTYNGNQTVFTPMDSSSYVRFNTNFMMMGMMFSSDSFYCDFNQLPGGLAPGASSDSLLFLYHFNFLDNRGQNMMYGNYGWGMGMMRFNNMVNFMLHYDSTLLDSLRINHQNLMLKYWSDRDSTWHMMSGYTNNQNNNTISFAVNSVDSYYGIFRDNTVSAINESNASTPSEFNLEQNYPNPFNPVTMIRFSVSVQSTITIKIFNIMGQEIKTLTQRNYQPGTYQISWDGTNNQNITVSSGIYIYQLKSDKYTAMKKMLLIK